jgi:hypothetical protein
MATPQSRNRTPQGTPTGGRFANETGARPSGELTSAPATQLPPDPAVIAALDSELEARMIASGNIETLVMKGLAQNLLHRFPEATHLDMEDGDQSEDDVTVAALRDAVGVTIVDLDPWDDDVNELIINLGGRRLRQHPAVHMLGTRNSPIYRIDLAAASALPTPTPTVPPAQPSWQERHQASQDSVSDFVREQTPDAVSWTATTQEWDNGYFYDDITAEHGDGTSSLLENGRAQDALAELSELEGPLGGFSTLVVKL